MGNQPILGNGFSRNSLIVFIIFVKRFAESVLWWYGVTPKIRTKNRREFLNVLIMKKIFMLTAMCAMFFSTVEADSMIGKCTFRGARPPYELSTGTTTIYYYEMSSSSLSSGGTEYKQCTGDVWVIYRSASDVKRIQVETSNGSVQVCYDF
jgi:hypothetical protein